MRTGNHQIRWLFDVVKNKIFRPTSAQRHNQQVVFLVLRAIGRPITLFCLYLLNQLVIILGYLHTLATRLASVIPPNSKKQPLVRLDFLKLFRNLSPRYIKKTPLDAFGKLYKLKLRQKQVNLFNTCRAFYQPTRLRRQLDQLQRYIKTLTPLLVILDIPVQLVYSALRYLTKKTLVLIYQVWHQTIWITNTYLLKPYQQINNALNKHHRINWLLVVFLMILTSLGVSSASFYEYIIKDLPDPAQLASIQPYLTSKIYDRNGVLLYKIYNEENRTLVPLEDIPTELIQATIAIEDQDFYSHPGFSIAGITRAIKVNTFDHDLQGGSTITQQLVKNTLLTSERTMVRKLKELVLSFLTEFYYTKDEILTMYFNQVPYGGTAYGVQAASRMLFDKDVKDLTLAQATFLAGLPAAPTKYSPYGAFPERAKERQLQVLRRMVEEGYISQFQAKQAAEQELALRVQKDPILVPHFVMYARDELAKAFGEQRVERGGLEVHTSIDQGIQQIAETAVREELENLKRLNVTNAAVLITKPKTGEILAMVGSRDYFDTTNDGQVNVTIRPRQPGSSIKPLTYAMALEKGLTPSSIIQDTPICFNIAGQPPYCPKNYDSQFHGHVTIRKALANSYNIPAVKVLNQFSVKELIEKGRLMGINTWEDQSRFGLSLTLGGGEVKMIDMAVAYGVFANLGQRVDLNPFLKITTFDGTRLTYQGCKITGNCTASQVLDPRVAYQITDILADNEARSQAFGRHSVLYIPNHQVAVKTGTTNSLRDNWTIGYTSEYLVAVWVGNNNNQPMSYIASGVTGASPIWNKVITQLLDNNNPHRFEAPTNLVKVNVCTITGQLACNGCPSKEEYFLPGSEPQSRCSPDQIADILKPKDQPQQTANN